MGTVKFLIKMRVFLQVNQLKTVSKRAQDRKLSLNDPSDDLKIHAPSKMTNMETFRSLTETRTNYKINNMEAVLSKLIKFLVKDL